MVSKKNLVGILTGPTASGKTALALSLAAKTQTQAEVLTQIKNRVSDQAQLDSIEIINADSLLVYREMNIGTAKPNTAELEQIPHHLINIRDPNESFTAGDFYRAAMEAIENIHAQGKRALIVGGTGFYLKTLLFGIWEAPPADLSFRQSLEIESSENLYQRLQQIDPQSAQRIGPTDRYRLIRSLEIFQLTGRSPTELQEKQPKIPDPRFRLWVIDRSNEEMENRIRIRTQAMLDDGLVDEFQQIDSKFPGCRPLGAVGYAQVSNFLRGVIPPGRKVRPGLDGLNDEIQLATRQLVKSQRTWFRGQQTSVPHSEWFQLDGDLKKLQVAFKTTYG